MQFSKWPNNNISVILKLGMMSYVCDINQGFARHKMLHPKLKQTERAE